ncbi:hypothetical protein [Leclercia tamurae]|uniref:hypothetical protein n=1 Tax=Leclercia tamurae TaxID=2926467 RepID=UPI0036F47A0E
MKKLIIALALVASTANAAQTVDEANIAKANALAEMATAIENHGPALGVTPEGMRNPAGVALKFTGGLHDVVAQGLARGATCEQITTAVNNGPVAAMNQDGKSVAGVASFTLALSEYAAADCVTTRARMEAAK